MGRGAWKRTDRLTDPERQSECEMLVERREVGPDLLQNRHGKGGNGRAVGTEGGEGDRESGREARGERGGERHPETERGRKRTGRRNEGRPWMTERGVMEGHEHNRREVNSQGAKTGRRTPKLERTVGAEGGLEGDEDTALRSDRLELESGPTAP